MPELSTSLSVLTTCVMFIDNGSINMNVTHWNFQEKYSRVIQWTKDLTVSVLFILEGTRCRSW
jgi:hypothetical protein